MVPSHMMNGPGGGLACVCHTIYMLSNSTAEQKTKRSFEYAVWNILVNYSEFVMLWAYIILHRQQKTPTNSQMRFQYFFLKI